MGVLVPFYSQIAESAQLGQLRQGRPDGLAWVELPDEHYAALDISQRHRSARLGSLREAGPQRLVWMDLSKECYAALDMVPGDESTSDHDTTDSSYQTPNILDSLTCII